MRKILLELCRDEAGSMALDWALVASILVLGAITGAVLTQPVPLPETEEPPVALR
jgi:hypothetical protein